jgi:hypothetical protein
MCDNCKKCDQLENGFKIKDPGTLEPDGLENQTPGCCGGCKNCNNECNSEEVLSRRVPVLEVKFTEAEIRKLDLKPEEVLLLTFKSNEIDKEDLPSLKQALERQFPGNKIMLLVLPAGSDMMVDVIRNDLISEIVNREGETE